MELLNLKVCHCFLKARRSRSWYNESINPYDAVLWAVEQGITTGTSATTFSPDATVTRGQVVTFLYRASGAPAVSGDISFTDVSADDYFYNAVVWAVEEGYRDAACLAQRT